MQPFLTRSKAAEFLTGIGIEFSEQGLADLARKADGPRYALIRNRALYVETDLLAWVAKEAARPVVRRSQRKALERGSHPEALATGS